jgi:signal transduction histidine kinase
MVSCHFRRISRLRGNGSVRRHAAVASKRVHSDVRSCCFRPRLYHLGFTFRPFFSYPSRALLALASGYLFTALIVIPHALTFPGAFSTTGLLSAGVQSTTVLYFSWHFGFSVALLAYAWLTNRIDPKTDMRASTSTIISRSVAAVVSLVCVLAWLAVAGDALMPQFFLDQNHFTVLTRYVFALNLSICALAFGVLLARRRSILNLWIMVVILALMLELVLVGLLSSTRFTVGFYAGRGFSLITSAIVLTVLVAETTVLFARIARSNAELQRERDNKLMTLEAVVASISHEIRQPIAAMTSNGAAGLRFLKRAPPDIEEAQSAMGRVVSDGRRTNQILEGIRALFGRTGRQQEAVNANETAVGALQVLRGELNRHGVTAHLELSPDLPLISGHRSQLQEVITNLLHNAIEAMDAGQASGRALTVRTKHQDGRSIILEVEDTGPGIDLENWDRIFEAFVTTKPGGTGLGLAICRMIIERHGGQISASAANPRGSIFQIILPKMDSSR